MAVTTGSATHWGPLWGARADDWATVEDQQGPTYAAALDHVPVEPGDRILEVGCGSGVFLRAAADRGAAVHGVDASEQLVELARRRVPQADIRVAEMQALPYPDDEFDAVFGFNAFFFATDMVAALREAGRVARPGARVVVQVWGRPEHCSLEAMKQAIFPGRGDDAASAPPPLCTPGVLEAMLTAAGLEPVDAFDGSWAFAYPDGDSLARALLSPGMVVPAIAEVGEETLAARIVEAMAPYRTGEGYVLPNEWHFAVGRA